MMVCDCFTRSHKEKAQEGVDREQIVAEQVCIAPAMWSEQEDT